MLDSISAATETNTASSKTEPEFKEAQNDTLTPDRPDQRLH